MRLITGDECGLLKEVIPALASTNKKKDDKEPVALKTPGGGDVIIDDKGSRRINSADNSSRRRGVVALAWVAEKNQKFSSLHMDGTVELWEQPLPVTERQFGAYRSYKKLQNVFGNDATLNVQSSALDPLTLPLGLSSFKKDEKFLLCTCNRQGKVVVIDADNEDSPIRSSFAACKVPEAGKTSKSIVQLLSAMAVDEQQSRFACGGKQRDVVLWDLHTSQQVFKAKNLPPDRQTLLAPQVWPTAICFWNTQQDEGGISPHILAVGTAHKEVRIYDIRTDSQQRRPIRVTPFGLIEHRVTSLCPIDSNQLVVGDAAGFLHAIDLRKLGRKIERVRTSIYKEVGSHGRFVGPAGSVQQIIKHEFLPRMAVVGLDRMLRVYNTEKRKQLKCIYLKQRLRCVLVGQDIDDDDQDDDDEGIDHLDDQDIDQEDIVAEYVDSDVEEGEGDMEDLVQDGVDESSGDDGQSGADDDSIDDNSNSGRRRSEQSDSESENSASNTRKKRRQ